MKNEIKMFIITLALILILPLGVKANDETDTIMRRLAPDLENAVFKMKKPTSLEEADFKVSGYVGSILNNEQYMVYGSCNPPYDVCAVVFQSTDYDSTWEGDEEVVISGYKKDYSINVTYDEPEDNETITAYLNNLNDFTWEDIGSAYIVEDLSLVNYYLTGNKSELWNPGAPGRALKFSTINKTTKGSNITYYLEVRAGAGFNNYMYEYAFGPMSVFYKGYSYGTKDEGVYLKRVIYIPESTTDTKEAYVAAAQERITDYLGNNSVTVAYGGTLEELNASLDEGYGGAEDEQLPIESDGNYYVITIADRPYNFYIVKGTPEQLKAPVYNGLDIETNIEISSEDSSIPLDTSLLVLDVDDSSIANKVGTENFRAYDISLFSDAKNADIKELSNGKFLVRIPVPDELKDKDKLIVWYIPSSGEKEEHEVTPKTIDGKLYAEFETNHFSTYILAEDAEDSELEILEGDNQTYHKGSNTTITIIASGKLADLQGVEIDNGNPLREGEYTLEGDENTKLILNATFLENSSIGEHTFTFKYEGGEVEAKLTIAEKEEEPEEEKEEETTPDAKEEETEKEEAKEKEDNPKTSDNIKQSFVLFAISFMIFAGTIVYKFEFNK